MMLNNMACKACYVHVPFCQTICAYCDFTRCGYHKGLADKWLTAVEQEIEEKLQGSLETLYLGGGTPTALTLPQLEKLLQVLQPYSSTCKEFTIEANVESFSKDKIALCKRYGVNRVSLGVQSLQPSLLKVIERAHSKEDILHVLQDLHEAGIHNISIDLMYGLPTQTMQMWQEDLQEVVSSFPISHISLYALTIEKNAKFGRNQVQPADAGLEADMYEYAIDFLTSHGFVQYEISSFAKDGKESMHNKMYWTYEDFYGIGCGASGKQHHIRYDNTKSLQTYLTTGSSPTQTPLSKEEEMFELLMMNLRLRKGMSLQHFYDMFHVDFTQYYAKPLQRMLDQNMLAITEGYVYASEKGYPLLHEILMEFMDE